MRCPRDSSSCLFLVCLFLFAAGATEADDFWKSKPSSEWSLKQAVKLLESSPWARQEIRVVAVRAAEPDATFDNRTSHCDPDAIDANGNCTQRRITAPRDSSQSSQVNISNRNEIIFLVRWESAGPVEQAFARLVELGERPTALFLCQAPRRPADRYVVTLRAMPAVPLVGEPRPVMPRDPYGPLEDDSRGPRAVLTAGPLIAPAAEKARAGVGASEAIHFYFPREVNGAPLLSPRAPAPLVFEFRSQRFTVRTRFTFDPASVE